MGATPIAPVRTIRRSTAMQPSLYEQDLYAWAMQSARLLRERRLEELDLDHLAEELESMGKSELRALESRLTVLLAHLLTWEFQPGKRSKSWQRTLIEQRKRIARLLRDSPSLRPKLADALADAYDSALRLAADETGIDESGFPQGCPYSLDQALDAGFYPEQ
jgi:hypothetical protein